jgi:hypothetical protein
VEGRNSFHFFFAHGITLTLKKKGDEMFFEVEVLESEVATVKRKWRISAFKWQGGYLGWLPPHKITTLFYYCFTLV